MVLDSYVEGDCAVSVPGGCQRCLPPGRAEAEARKVW